jgi:hypothetical protein
MFRRSQDLPPTPDSRLDDIARRVRNDKERLRERADSSTAGLWFEEPEMSFDAWPAFSDIRKRDRF